MAKAPATMLIKYKAPAILANSRGDSSAIRAGTTAVLMLISTLLSRPNTSIWRRRDHVLGVNRAALRASDGDHDLALRVSFFELPDRLGRLAQRVTSLDHRRDLAGLDEISHQGQVLLVQFRDEEARLLGPDPRDQWPEDHGLEHGFE